MSDIATTDVSVDAGVAAPSEGLVEVGSTDPISTPTEELGAPEQSTLTESEVEALFEIDGQKITLDEARSGYLRQSDYTRKTQELAERSKALQRAEALAQAYESNPLGTLQALAEAAGVPAQFGQVADPYADLDPEQRTIAELQQRVEALQSDRQREAIDRELASLKATYGDFDQDALFAHAIRTGQTLTSAYRDMNFDQVAEMAAQAQKAREAEAARLEEKRVAASAVQTGATRAGTTAPAKPEMYGSVKEAYLAAKQALGL